MMIPPPEPSWPFGWLLSRAELRAPKGWNSEVFGRWHLVHHPSLPVFIDHNQTSMILGFAVDPDNPSNDENQICETLSTLAGEARQTYIDRLAGRFILAFRPSITDIRVQQDAMGLRAAYYTDQQYQPVIGSHMMLVAGQVKAPINVYGSSNYLRAANEKTYPGRMTARLGVMRLTPNLEWSSTTQSVHRIFPRDPRTPVSVADARTLVSQRVNATIEAFNHRQYELMVSLTAGLDSRVTTAFLHTDRSIKYFTYDVRYREKNRANRFDVEAASKLAESLGLHHDVLILDGAEVDKEVQAAMARNWPLRHSRELAVAYKERLPLRLHIRSSGFGIAQAYWKRYGFGETDLNSHEMRRIASSKRGREHASLDAFQEYINTTEFTSISKLVYDPYDFFLWEMRVGSWLTTALHESDIAHETHVLLNSREMLKALLSVPEDERKSSAVFLSILESADPLLLQVPINGESIGGKVRDQETRTASFTSGGDNTRTDPATGEEAKIQAALRQSDGPGFETTSRDEALVESILAAEIVLPPHPRHKLTGPIDWNADPFDQRNWRAQLHMLRWLDPLRRVSRTDAKRRPELMAIWERTVRNWSQHNTPVSKSSPSAWLSMTDAVRVETLINGLAWVENPSFILQLLELHGNWLVDERRIGHSNHALRQHSALFQIGAVLNRDDWITLAVDRLKAHANDMFDSEGMNSEGAVRYWEMNRRWTQTIANRLELEGVNARFLREKLSLAAEALAFATRPDGQYEPLGDSDPSGPQSDGTAVLDYVTSDGRRGSAPTDLARIYSRGFAFGRSGWGEIGRSFSDESFYSLIYEGSDKVHGHEDAGSITFFAKRNPVLVDAGKFAYVTSRERTYCESRQGHNLITIDGMPYDRTQRVKLLEHQISDELDYYVLEDRGYSGVRIQRIIAYSRATESLLVLDNLRSEKEVTARWRWHLTPAARTTIDGAAVHVDINASRYALLWGGSKPQLEVVRGQENPFEGWFSPGWNKIVPSDVIVATRTGKFSRTSLLIQSEGTEGRQLQSFPIKDGIGYVARGNGVVACLLVEGNSVRSIPTDEAQLPVLIEELRTQPPINRPQIGRKSLAPKTYDQAMELDQIVAGARALLGNFDAEERISESLSDLSQLMLNGFDQGAVAALRDLRASSRRLPIDDPVMGRVPHREGFDFSGGNQSIEHQGRKIDLVTSSHDSKPPVWKADREGIHVYNAGSLSFPFLYRPGRGSVLLVCLSGAQDRGKVRLPRFEWYRQFEGIDTPLLLVSDPTLDLAPDLRLGWYLGSASIDGAQVIATQVRRYAETLGVEEIWIMGTSGGGFAAMQIGALVPSSHVLAVNPQTDVRKYISRFSQRALKQVFGTALPPNTINQRLSVVDRIAATGGPINIELILNEGDSHHREQHVNPFLREVDGLHNAVCGITNVNWGPGHVLRAEEVISRVSRAIRDRI